MYEININSNKTIRFNEKQFALLKLIGQLGFVNSNQLNLIWSVINKTYVSCSYSTIRRWITAYHLLKKRPITPSKTKRSSNLSRPVYYLSSIGVRMLQKYQVDYIPLSRLKFNSHNEQCNEVTIQTLFKAAFDADLLNKPNQKPFDNKVEHILASSNFNLDKLDLRPFARQIINYQKYPFVPDQIIGFTQNNQRCEIMIELDNRTENDKIQLQKILNYLEYAYDNPHKRILMVIAITDGSLPNYRVPKYRSPYQKINNLLAKFKNSTVSYRKQRHSIADIYRKVKNLTITIAGVAEAHVDLADFINSKNYVEFSIVGLKKMAMLLTKRFNHKVYFQRNQELRPSQLNYLDIQGLTLGNMVYNTSPAIYQTVKVGYEHSLDTYLDLCEYIPQNYIYSFPARVRRLLVPSIPKYYESNPSQSKFSHLQGMIYQPVVEDNINLNLVLHLLFTQYHYYRYLYKFFTAGKISATDNPQNYTHLTYIRSTTYPFINPYLKKLHIRLKNIPSRPYRIVHLIAAKSDSAKEFSRQIHIQDIPIEVMRSILRQISIKSFSTPYYPTSSSRSDFDPDEYLYLPDQINPDNRTKISF